MLRPRCVVSGNACTVRIPITNALNNVSVDITTPRKNHGAYITDNNHSPFNAMYNADETSTGMTFTLMGVASTRPGTVLVIVFKLVPAGSSSPPSGKPSPPVTSGTGALSLTGPRANKLGSSFSYAVVAKTTSAAVFAAYELTGAACAASASGYTASQQRVQEPVPAGSFHVVFHLVAEPAGTFALCLYLLNPATHATEAHAGAHWTNSS